MLLSEKVSEEIKLLIVTGELKRGEKIPSEFVLADRLGVSRNTVRDAVKLLVSNNVLNIMRGKGTFVSINPGIGKDPLGLYFVAPSQLRGNLEELRLMMEPEIAALAAQKATDQEAEDLLAVAQDMQKQIDKYSKSSSGKKYLQKIMAYDLQFHSLMCNICKNDILDQIYPYIIHNLFDIYASENFQMTLSKPQRINTHLALCEAIRDHDSQKASLLMQRHIMNSRFASGSRPAYDSSDQKPSLK